MFCLHGLPFFHWIIDLAQLVLIILANFGIFKIIKCCCASKLSSFKKGKTRTRTRKECK